MSLAAIDLSYAYTSDKLVLDGITLSLDEGGVTFVLGGNGSGKTTLLECLCGIRSPRSGSVQLDGKEAYRLPPMQRARRIGFVPQIHEPIFTYSVYHVVLMGRSPHLGPFAKPRHSDHEAVAQALDALDLWPLRNRPYTEISGGERRLVLIARGLAQGVRYLLMDEPDAHLDPLHQHEVFSRVRELVIQGFTFAISSHSPNSALTYGDWAILLSQGKPIAYDRAAVVVSPAPLVAAYGLEFELISDESGPRAVIPISTTLTQS